MILYLTDDDQYFIGPSAMSYQDAYDWCQDNGLQIVEIYSQEKQNAIENFIIKHGNICAIIYRTFRCPCGRNVFYTGMLQCICPCGC